MSELLASRVIDQGGRDLGPVDDVHLVQDGPLQEGIDAALRIDGVVVGAGGIAIRLGYHRRAVKGPALLKAQFHRLERRALFVPWDEVDTWDGSTLALRVPASELHRLDER